MNRTDSVEASNIKNDPLTHRIIGAAIEVHRHLGPGLLESTYEECLCHELTLLDIPFERQVSLPIVYKSMTLLRAYKPDLLVDKAVIIELKSVEKILPVHEAQMLTYLRLSGLDRGLLLNFNSAPLKAGIRRLNKSKSSPVSQVSPVSPFPLSFQRAGHRSRAEQADHDSDSGYETGSGLNTAAGPLRSASTAVGGQ
jgi:GxxExxY protein